MELDGITLVVPDGWKRVHAAPREGAIVVPEAIFHLTRGEGSGDLVMVRVTRLPIMRSRPTMVKESLERWCGQFTQPDGRATKDVASVETLTVGPCEVTLADISGTSGRMRLARTDQRMLGAIIEHPNGPFFVVARGPAPAVESWKPSFLSYIKSIRASRDRRSTETTG